MSYRPRVAIIGAGWAGLAAAIHLSDRVRLTVFEAGREPGGRARSVLLDNQLLDNGQHILIGAYHRSLALMEKVGVNIESAFVRLPLTWNVHNGIQLRCPLLPSPLHFAWALLSAQGISWWDKWHMMRAVEKLKRKGWKAEPDLSVAHWLQATHQQGNLTDGFWQPLVLSALNTPLDQASLNTLAHVLADSLGGKREDSDLLIPRLDFSTLFAKPAWDFLGEQSVELRSGWRVQTLIPDGEQIIVDNETFDAVICALPSYQLAPLLPENHKLLSSIHAQQFEPISTVYLHYPLLPKLSGPMTGLTQRSTHWLFDRERLSGNQGVVAGVISCSADMLTLSHEELIQLVSADVRLIDSFAGEPDWGKVITEKRATFASVIGRPIPRPRLSHIRYGYVAGDWAHCIYPATLEGAVQSGYSAAEALLRDLC